MFRLKSLLESVISNHFSLLIPGSCGGKAKAEHIRESSLECAVAREGKNMAYTVGPISYRMILDLISFHGLLLVYSLKSCP